MTQLFPPNLPERVQRSGRAILAAKSGKVPVRALIPNLFTLLGLCAGLTAIRMAFEARFDIAIAAVVIAALIDAIDGRMARLLKTASRFGAELDSLADFVNFGVAPAIIIYTWGLKTAPSLGWLAVLIFALAAALRLARFNVASGDEKPLWEQNFFTGVPATAGAITVLLPLYLEGLGVPHSDLFLTPVVLIYTVAIAVLMVSRIPTFAGKLVGRRIELEHIVPIFIAAVLGAAVLATYPYLTLTAASLLYLAAIPFGVRHYHTLKKAAAQQIEQEAPVLREYH